MKNLARIFVLRWEFGEAVTLIDGGGWKCTGGWATPHACSLATHRSGKALPACPLLVGLLHNRALLARGTGDLVRARALYDRVAKKRLSRAVIARLPLGR